MRQVHARFRVPRPRRRGSPPARTCAASHPAEPAGEAPPPGPRPWRWEGENRLPKASLGGRGRRRVPHLRPAPPRPAPEAAAGPRRCLRAARRWDSLRSPRVRARCGDGNTGNPGTRRISELRETVERPAFIQTPATGGGGALHRKMLSKYLPQFR